MEKSNLLINEITVFTYGDSNSLSTWSNVPFYFTNTFEHLGVKVNRINVEPNIWLTRLWNHLFLKVIRLFSSGSTYEFDRTPLFRLLTSRVMYKAVKNYPRTDLFISISFSYHPKKYTNKPVMLFGDWTYDYYFKYFLNRLPGPLEKQEIYNQKKLRATADAILVLFPDVCKFINEGSSDNKIFYLGNVINSDPYTVSATQMNSKYKHNNIVFIGSKKYLDGLKTLLLAIRKIDDNVLGQVYVIGMTDDDIPDDLKSSKVIIKGYLNKSVEAQRNDYYSIVNDAKIFVNTTPKWASFSASLDVMYHYTPVITTPYQSFIETFGEKINSGLYSENDVEELKTNILKIMTLDFEEYSKMAMEARTSVNDFTWAKYIDKLNDKLIDNGVIKSKKAEEYL